GRPIANTRIYVLDEQMQPVPVGVTGEIYIAGEGLARGYLNRSELTAERFLPDPFSEGRLYRTGDVGRHLGDGNLEYVGRVDHQLKMRGYRIEPGEIEVVLERHPEVRQAVVVAATRSEDGADKRLVAYVVGEAGARVEVERLREYLEERLPDYMVPGLIVEKERLPLTSNGKVDRRVLSEWEQTRVEERSEYEAPRTKVEKKVAEIWEEVLGVERIGLHDSFFELGGHSLIVMRVASRIYKTFNVELSLHDFFKAPTIADLGMAIVLKHTESQDREKVMQALAGLE
ncbi:MAG: phosphopantetheine-binding protein, partial [Pyrinomonadaceae bacterium]